MSGKKFKQDRNKRKKLLKKVKRATTREFKLELPRDNKQYLMYIEGDKVNLMHNEDPENINWEKDTEIKIKEV